MQSAKSVRARRRLICARLLGRGVTSLFIGLAFMFDCLPLRRWLAAGGNHGVLAEGLLLIGWVALWRPVEIFLYDWWQIRRQQKRFEFIAQMPVEIGSEAGSSIGPSSRKPRPMTAVCRGIGDHPVSSGQ